MQGRRKVIRDYLYYLLCYGSLDFSSTLLVNGKVRATSRVSIDEIHHLECLLVNAMRKFVYPLFTSASQGRKLKNDFLGSLTNRHYCLKLKILFLHR